MTRPLCGIVDPWAANVGWSLDNLAAALEGTGLYRFTERLKRASRDERRELLVKIRDHAETARAAFYLVMADAKAEKADEVMELCSVLLQKIPGREEQRRSA